jgi:2-keto-4-pentenoate hydratase
LEASLQAKPDIEGALELLIAARREQKVISSLPDEFKPANVDAGYALQEALTVALDETAVGWKIACTNAAAQKLMETDEPFAGPLFESMLHTSPARLSASQFNMRMVEGEFAFRLGFDLPARAEPYTRSEVEAAVAAVHPAIEIADSRFNDWLAVGLPSLVADGAVSGAFVYGEGRSDWHALDLINWPVTMTADGEIVGRGTGAGALGDPLSALLWLVNKRSKQGGGLSAGQIVTTGTCTGNFQAQPGTTVVADFGEMGEIRVSFAPDR